MICRRVVHQGHPMDLIVPVFDKKDNSTVKVGTSALLAWQRSAASQEKS